jgi:hypothetical protein
VARTPTVSPALIDRLVVKVSRPVPVIVPVDDPVLL